MDISLTQCHQGSLLSLQDHPRQFSINNYTVNSTFCSSGRWVNLASIPTPRQEHGTVAIGNSTIAIVGGIASQDNSSTAVTTDLVQLYDIAYNTWRTVSPALFRVNHPNLASVAPNKLNLLGGLTDVPHPKGQDLDINWNASKDCYNYDAATDTWAEVASMPSGTERGSSVVESRQHATGAVIGDTFYVIGGRRYGQMYHRDTVFELALQNIEAGWRTSTGHMPTSRGGIFGVLLMGSSMFSVVKEIEIPSPRWVELMPMAVPRHGTQAAVAEGCIYIPGGGLQQDGKEVIVGGKSTYHNPTSHFDAYCP
ncbi:galactose oxidase [Aspergillus eucalypticola CBS 122712]|uniref:Galactose oxidase n=1 Tax=Aspergillus eucalypticola (strain CBS 122712 / IBT 29274) TaxID=1448314 RepID=A0A317W912_ASPEC|nr:galactose oxidase [Aspergillus eucalypticola CBS 122712]PWY82395.1 galactose oxidase [Aspergillus eucalypticola CBS 122712]